MTFLWWFVAAVIIALIFGCVAFVLLERIEARETQRDEPTDDELVGWVDEIAGDTDTLEEQ